MLPLLLLACARAPVPTSPVHASPVPEAHAEVELAALMLRMQTHAEKLYWAGTAENAPLVDFYLHELEETIETIAAAGITEDGADISALAPTLLGPRIEALEESADFAADYDALVAGCNECHAAAEHAFIRIQVPTTLRFTNQDFAPQAL